MVRALLNRGRAVRVLVRPESNRRNIVGLDVEVVTGDLTKRASLVRAMRGCVALYHVAADYRLWVPRPEEMYEANEAGTRRIMEAALEAGIEQIVYTSSVATLGLRADGRPADEDTPSSLKDMIGHYKRSKFLAEQEVKKLIREEGLRAVIVNPSTPVGPRDVKPTPTGRLIVNALAGKMPAYVDTGLNIVHVDDVAEGHVLAMERGRIGQRYILGGENLTLSEILERLATIGGRKPPRIRLPHGLVMPLAHVSEAWARLTGAKNPMLTKDGVKMARKHMFFTSRKAMEELDYRPRPAIEALRDAARWFRENNYA